MLQWKQKCGEAQETALEVDSAMDTLIEASKKQGEANSKTIEDLQADATKWKRKFQDAEEKSVCWIDSTD